MAEKKRVMGFGTFDAVHPGHLFYLRQLRELGDELTIVIARDKSVTRIKGRAPRFSEVERKAAVEATGLADKVVLGHEGDFMKVLHEHAPHVLGFGYDQRVDISGLRAQFPRIEMIRLEAHEPHKYKSSLVKVSSCRIPRRKRVHPQ